ncbi:MAG: hypothetical protein M3160_04880 [Candidatus Eremiobacteraeota bacterium]|nr:hypothetical protein [Candidatus Eremiobacteraeota bacterium]
MDLRFTKACDDDGISVLQATLTCDGAGKNLAYSTRTGALLRVNGAVAGAFDAKHSVLNLPTAPAGASLRLEVERASLPISGLPSGPGLVWWWMNLRSHPKPALHAKLSRETHNSSPPIGGAQTLIGHAHLDVAWLWTYEQTRRKALRTFATAARQIERFPHFVYTQSQPQLYEFVRQADSAFFERVRGLAADGRFDTTVAALWVESDCNIPSGEALLCQMLFAHRFVEEHFAQRPCVAWLPDSFGFANTVPTLLAHAGIAYFATTKLQWNDSTRFPYNQFVWRGPDGSDVLAAQIESYEGDLSPNRLATARKRKEPLIVGYGDGGGGVPDAAIERAADQARWIRPKDWFSQLESERSRLPVHEDELYLQYHRGVFTTHHRVKARNARLERQLSEAEECAAWCVAIGASRSSQAALRERLSQAWNIVLRNQFHDVITGTSIGAVYDDVHVEYDEAEALVRWVRNNASSMLSRTALHEVRRPAVQPIFRDGYFAFGNDRLSAQVFADGRIAHLSAAGGANVVKPANVLTAYVDEPKEWDAWNIDAGYQRRTIGVAAGRACLNEGALEVPITMGRSHFTMRLELRKSEPFLRVEIDGVWNELHRLLRVENTLNIDATEVTYGTPHGTLVRCSRSDTAARRAQFEVPGQRYALVREETGAALALLTLDTYGWNATLRGGAVHLGHSLLRAPVWPDPAADRGEQHLEYAFAPFSNVSIGLVERTWHTYAHGPRVALFASQDDGVLVVACKPADDGGGVILRIRECDGRPCTANVVCAAEPRSVIAIDALERRTAQRVGLQGQTIVAEIGPYALRSFRVCFQ